MSTAGWVIVAILAIPMIGLFIWLILGSSVVQVPSGSLGLLMIRGRATDTALQPGRHFVPALRQRAVEIYPSVEQPMRAGAPDTAEGVEFDRTAPAVPVTLGDRTTTTIPFTLRYRLLPEHLREIHERTGPAGVFAMVRDVSAAAVVTSVRAPTVTIDSFFGAEVGSLEQRLRDAVSQALSERGVELSGFLLGSPDFGRTGDVIQATLRARLEIEREQAEAATRLARASNDAELNERLRSTGEGAWRYRESELWSDLVERTEALQVALRAIGPNETGGSARRQVAVDAPPTESMS